MMTMKRLITLLFLIASVCVAEDNGNDDGNNDGNDDGNDAYVDDANNGDDYYVGDDDANNADDYTNTNDDSFSAIQVCSDSLITVTGIELLCDSPGTFYYGSGLYRNSRTCEANDKGKIKVYFDIEEDLETDAYVTIAVEGAGEERSILYSKELCNLKSEGMLKSSYRTKCPGYGSYRISTSFSWNMSAYGGYAYDDDGYSHFTPTLSVGFASNEGSNKFDLGGANVASCGDNFLNTVENYISGHNSSALSIVWSFGILIATMGIIGLFIFYLVYKPGQENYNREATDFSGSFDAEYVSVEEQKALSSVGKGTGLVRF